MKFRSALSALEISFPATLLGALVTISGCGGNECTKAADHFQECLQGAGNTGSSGSTGSTGSSAAATTSTTTGGATKCAEPDLCRAKCATDSDCGVLRDAVSATPNAENSYLKCVGDCATAQ